jgi:hypothetical protein
MMIRRSRAPLYSVILCSLVLLASAGAQDSGTQPSLGDLARQQRELRRHEKPPTHVLTDDDVAATGKVWTAGYAAEFVIIPEPRIEGLAPRDPAAKQTFFGRKINQMYVSFGPHLNDKGDWCSGSFECSERSFLRRFGWGGWVPGSARILFDSDATVGDYQARVAHFEALHNGRGKMLGSVALIATPFTTLMASCIYEAKDRTQAEPDCDGFISSLKVVVPEHYIYVHSR